MALSIMICGKIIVHIKTWQNDTLHNDSWENDSLCNDAYYTAL